MATSLDRCLLVVLADQVRNAGTLDEVLESLNGAWVNPLAVAGASERHLAWLHAADKTCQQVVIASISQETVV